MSKKTTQFLDLEDISLRCVFQYLPITDRFTLYVDLPPCRIQLLLENFISFVDISDKDDRWIAKYLLVALLQQKIHGRRLKDEQIHFVSKYFSLGDIQTIHLISTYLNDEVSINYRISLNQSLNKLVLLHDTEARNEQIRIHRWQSLHNRHIYPIIDQDRTFHNLSELSIYLKKFNSIFHILQRLPNLQILKMHLERSYSEKKIDFNSIQPCKMLRDVTITGEPDYRHGFNEFFSIFGSTIKSLTPNTL